MQPDIYKTIKKTHETELKEKGSRFISRAFPVSDRGDAELLIKKISKQHYDATHNCFAYKIGTGPDCVTRYNDDGEPSGTAGKPILQSIEGRDLTNILVIVTRYFGGTKLGTGGLVRAYGGAASMTLDSAKIIELYIKESIKITYDYPFSNLVNTLIQRYQAHVDKVEYEQQVMQTVSIRKSLAKEFAHVLVDQSSGNITVG